jgi:hypothetical protein
MPNQLPSPHYNLPLADLYVFGHVYMALHEQTVDNQATCDQILTPLYTGDNRIWYFCGQRIGGINPQGLRTIVGWFGVATVLAPDSTDEREVLAISNRNALLQPRLLSVAGLRRQLRAPNMGLYIWGTSDDGGKYFEKTLTRPIAEPGT